MKLKLYLLALLTTMFAFTSCDNDDDDDITAPPTAVVEAFSKQYPNITAKWENERGQLKAEFWTTDGRQAEAWYSTDGTWTRTETDYKQNELPQAVADYIATTYPGYHYEDIELVETPAGKYFDIEVEQGDNDIHVLVNEDGTLHK